MQPNETNIFLLVALNDFQVPYHFFKMIDKKFINLDSIAYCKALN